jgi:acetoacetyl-CoA synthetase
MTDGTTTSAAGRLLWTPPSALIEQATMTRFMRWLNRGHTSYDELWRWSVDDLEGFWRAIWDFFDVQADGSPDTVLARREMPAARWFPDVALSYPEHIFRDKDDAAIALHHASELREPSTWTWSELREQTARIRAGLDGLGVGRGDRVVGYMPNIPETIAAFLATASLGAVWSSCSPDFGVRSVVERFAQIEPKVLLAVDGYRYGGKDFDRADVIARLKQDIPSLVFTAVLPYLGEEGNWDEVFPATDVPVSFERVPFDHPLWVLYSSGTTGLPKAIVHSQGGILLEHLKTLHLHVDAQAGDRIFWFTTTGWMMWNFLVGGLLTPATIVLFDGNPGYPDMGAMWDLAERTGTTCFGTSAAFIHGCMKAHVEPGEGRDLSALRSVGSTGSPLSPEGFEWVYEHVGEDTWLFSTSGGTDVCTAFVGGVPLVPVYEGELQARSLGADLRAFDEEGNAVMDEVGELVLAQPMPSMPVYFWNDPDGERYRESYFSMYPGIWRHGDWIRITPRGSAVIYGRSDATINRGGIRMGTAEIYRSALAVDAVQDALIVDVPPANGTGDSWMPLFVVLPEGRELDDGVIGELRRRIRQECSPRHVPDEVIQVAEIPRTLSGKVLEVPVKKILMGGDPAKAASRDSLANPAALDWFIEYARTRTAAHTGST